MFYHAPLSFDLPPACKEDINKIFKSLNANKATGPDEILLKFIKLSANVVDKCLNSIINLFLRWSKERPSQTYL